MKSKPVFLTLHDRRALSKLRQADPTLAPLMERVGAFRLELQGSHSVFEALAEAIVYQQLTGKAAATIFGRVKALYPRGRLPRPEVVLRTPHPRLRGAGLSRNKILALEDLASKIVDGTVPTLRAIQKMPDDEIIERLTAVRGIGRWTAEMLLIFRLGRPDVLPVDDYGVRKGYALTFGMKDLPKPRALAEYGERWRPFRTVASWYLWRSLDLAKKG